MANGDLQAEFEKFGMVTDVYNTGKGFAFVTFDRKEDAETVGFLLYITNFYVMCEINYRPLKRWMGRL